MNAGRRSKPSAENGSPAAKSRRRQDIVDAAAGIFSTKGYEATSMQDIAAAVGMLKGSLYYYIETKEDLLLAICLDAHSPPLGAVERVSALAGDPLQRLYALVLEHVAIFAENRTKTAVFFREFRSLSKESQALITAKGDAYTTYVRALLAEGQHDGLIDSSLDPKLASIGVIGLVNSMLFWYDPAGPATVDQIAHEFARMAVASVASDRHQRSVGGRNAMIAGARNHTEEHADG